MRRLRLAVTAFLSLAFILVQNDAFVPNWRVSRRISRSICRMERRRDSHRPATTSKNFVRQRVPRHKAETPSVEYQRILRIVKNTKTVEELEVWMNRNAEDRQSLGITPREETDLIRELSHRRAYKALLVFVRQLARKTVFVYTSAISALANSNSLSYRQTTVMMELLDEMDTLGIQPNSYTFTALLHSADGAQASSMMMERIKTYASNVPIGVEVYNTAIHACSRDGAAKKDAWQPALHFVTLMRKQGIVPNQQTYASLMHVCAQVGQVRIAMSLLQEMQTVPNDMVWGAALNACAQAGDSTEAMKVLQMMQDSGVRPNTFHTSALVTALAKTGQDRLALDIFNAMAQSNNITLMDKRLSKPLVLEPISPDLVIINTVLAACAKAGNYVAAKDLLERLKRGEFHVPDARSSTRVAMTPDVISYNTVLSACSDPIEARAIVKEMRLSRRHRYGATPPTSITYTNAITICRKAEIPDLPTALFFLETAKNDGIVPNVFMYSAVIWTAERNGDYESALRILEDMKSPHVSCRPNVVTYNGVISALATHGRAEDAVTLFDEIKDNGLEPTTTTFQRLASAIRRTTDNVDKSWMLEHVMSRMSPLEMRAKLGGAVIEALIRQYGACGDYDAAVRVFQLMQGPTDAYCLRAILYACSEAVPPRWEDALSILHTSDIVEGSRGPAKVDPKALNYAMLACAKADQWEEALILAELYGRPMAKERIGIVKDSPVPLTLPAFNALIAACGRCGQPGVAIRLLNEMELTFGVVPDERTYRRAIIACNQAEHDKRRRQQRGLDFKRLGEDDDDDDSGPQWWECALSLLRRMKENKLEPDPQTYSSVISACEAAGQWQRALGVLQSMMTKKGQDDDAHARFNLYCFNAAISACEKGGAWVEALELYYRMKEQGGAVKPNFVTLNSLLVALDKAGQKELALATYEDSVRSKLITPWKITRAAGNSQIRAMDLHRFSGAMANTAIRSVMESLLDSRPTHDITRDLVVIVGKGKGSEYRPVLMATVRTLLQSEYGIVGQVEDTNTGRLVIHSSVLQSYATSKRWR